MPTDTVVNAIRAAGGILWRQGASGIEIALVYRKRYDDWSLPKGKLDQGESWQEAALREVQEETGHAAIILGFAGNVNYEVKGRPKEVRFWHMRPIERPTSPLDDEVAEVAWLSIEQALGRLDYALERELLRTCIPPMLDSPHVATD